MSTNAAKEAAKAAGSQTALAKALGCTPQNVQRMCANGQIPAKHVLKVEAITGIPRSRLRPDMYPDNDESVMAIVRGEEVSAQAQKNAGIASSAQAGAA